MEVYKKWVRQNKDYVHSLESLANGLTWLLPERFSASEVGPEAVTAALGIITAINEHIIETTPARVHASPAEPRSFPYPLCISILKDLETLVEVVAEQYYGDKKWSFIVATEATKVAVRLALFRNSGYKMLLHGGESSNVRKDQGQTNRAGFAQGPGGHIGAQNLQNYNGENPWFKGRALSAFSRFGENARMASGAMVFTRLQSQHSVVKPPTPILERPSLSAIISERGFCGALFMIGEVLFITRPLLYVLLIRKYGIRSWVPWFVSLAVDMFGTGILTQVTNPRWGVKRKHIHLSGDEEDEIKRRKLLWVLYLMRDPFFSKYTRQKLDSTMKILEPVPVIGLLTEKIVELLTGAQTRYTYMSGS